MAGVRIDNVTKVYDGKVTAVDRANLEIRDKEFLVLVGPSGCGKSTILRMIAGLEEITGGEIRIGERLVNRIPPKDRNVAMVFQNYALYPHMNVRRNMAFGLQIRKYPKQEIATRVDEAAKILGIEELLDRRPRALSGGQRQRVALGRAIVRRPEVFLFDEPLSNLDAKLRVEMRAELIRLHRRLATTMIYVTHDQVEAMTLGNRIVVMDQGVIQQVGAPMEVYEKPANRFLGSFIGTPPMNFIDGTLHGEGPRFAFEGQSVPLPVRLVMPLKSYEDKLIALGVRPEDLEPVATAGEGPDNSFKATVEVLEPLGHETLVHMAAGKAKFVAKVPFRASFDVEDTVRVKINFDRAHLFDAETGANLTLCEESVSTE